MSEISIIDTTADNILDYGICGYKNIKRAGYPEKVEWLKDQYKQELKIKTLYSEIDGTQGMIEYLPGEFCWRPVAASGYMFIHCIMVGFKRIYKNQGYGSLLIDEAIKDAKNENMHGVAVVTRKGSFMADKELFINNGFEIVDSAQPDFHLLVKKFDDEIPSPKFIQNFEKNTSKYGDGLTIIRANQCPYTVKNVNEICEVAENEFNIKPKIVELRNHTEAQDGPCPFGVFSIIYDGEIISHHPISKTRFMNIMRKII